MKLLYTVILLLGITQLVLTETSTTAANSSSLLAKNQLEQFYAKESNALSRETCVKFNKMSHQILKDHTIKQAKTPVIAEFKRNITHFQEIYPIYIRYGLNKQLLLIFSATTINYYYREPTADKESQYILQLLRKLGYDEIYDQFENNFAKFVTDKFVPKFEEFKSHIAPNETEQFQKLLQWGEEMKKCQLYACFFKYFNSFDKIILTPKQQLFAYITEQLKEINVFYGNSALQIARGVLKSKKLLQLTPNLRDILKQNIAGFIAKYESTNDTNELYGLSTSFYQNVLLPFYGNTEIPTEEGKLLIATFDEQGYAQLQRNYYRKFIDFVDLGLFKRFENFRASLSQAEMVREKTLLQWFENFKNLYSYDDRTEALMVLYTLM